MDHTSIINFLARSGQARLTAVQHVSVRHVSTFEGYRDGKMITIRIEDYGPDYHAPQYRYRCIVEVDDEFIATGNGDRTPELAMASTHWDKLKRFLAEHDG